MEAKDLISLTVVWMEIKRCWVVRGGIRWLECRQFHSTRLEMKKDFYIFIFEPVVGEFFKYIGASIWK